MSGYYAEGFACAIRRNGSWEADLPARFYFDLEDGHEVIRDDEGVEADDLSQAIDQALAGVDDVRASGELQGLGLDWQLVIRDARGAEIKRIPLW